MWTAANLCNRFIPLLNAPALFRITYLSVSGERRWANVDLHSDFLFSTRCARNNWQQHARPSDRRVETALQRGIGNIHSVTQPSFHR